MRMRFKPYARAELLASDFHVHDPFVLGGKWHAQYARPEQPFVLELGCGKGGFLSQLACAHPENNYLGIDITDKVLILAKRKVEAAYAERGEQTRRAHAEHRVQHDGERDHPDEHARDVDEDRRLRDLVVLEHLAQATAQQTRHHEC